MDDPPMIDDPCRAAMQNGWETGWRPGKVRPLPTGDRIGRKLFSDK
jgi:hypothetical protein